MQPGPHFAFSLFCLLFSHFLLFSRFFLLRHKPRAPNDIAADVLFVVAVCIRTGIVVCICRRALEEKRVRDTYHTEHEVAEHMYTPYWLRTLYFMCVAYTCELWVLKGAFLGMYWGLFHRIHTRLRYMLYGATILTVLSFIAAMAVWLAWCQPIQRNWTSDPVDFRRCASLHSPFTLAFQAILNMTTDAFIMGLPLLVIQQLSLKTAEKIALMGVFAVGGFSIASSAVRFSMLNKVVRAQITLESIRKIELWTELEVCMALLTFCLPALRGYIVTLFTGGKNRSDGYKYKYPENGTVGSGRKREVKPMDLMATDVSIGAYVDEVVLKDVEMMPLPSVEEGDGGEGDHPEEPGAQRGSWTPVTTVGSR